MTYNAPVVERAEQVIHTAIQDVLRDTTRERGVIVEAVAGAGKTSFIVDVVGAADARGRTQVVCTPTNLQAFELVDRLARRYPRRQVTFLPATDVHLPSETASLANVRVHQRAVQAHGDSLLVGTFDKMGDAFNRGALAPRDLLLADESYQADSARYYGVGGLARTHLLVGDAGQVSPFSTMDDDDRWRGLAEDPLQTAVGILRRNHPDTPAYRLPITRRLDPRAVPVARAFYPGYPLDAAVLPGVRQLRLLGCVAQDAYTRLLDRALESAATEGWAHIELPDTPVLTADPDTIRIIVDLLCRLRERAPEVRCERVAPRAPLAPHRIAVGVSHKDQADHLLVALAAAGLGGVVVATANRLQGLEFDLVIAWHPLAGLPDEPDGFHLDPGRLCVLLTRHRHACIVVGRQGDRAFLDGIPPSTPAYLGWDADPVLDGWDVHQTVFDALEPYRFVA